MCGELKLEHNDKLVGKRSYISGQYLSGSNKDVSYQWTSFARTDGSVNGDKSMPDQWNSKDWKVSLLHVTGYTEKDKNGNSHMFNANRIGCIVNKATRELRILTRPAKTDYEKSVHHRAPSKVSKNTSLKEYVSMLNNYTKGNYKCV